jgi:N-methylhydantoinase A/oxoprolinase/acetone carboxylase beta subunit
MRIGIDVGGTHTDAVLLQFDEVVAATKALTTTDVTSGILEALETVLSDSRVPEQDIEAVMLGTTQFTNAVVQRRQLSEVAAIRVGLPSGDGLPPKTGWPDDISKTLGEHTYLLRGGFLYDGRRLAEIDDNQVDVVVRDLKHKRISAVAISSAFSPMMPEPEVQIGEKIRNEIPGVRITLSHRIGRLGLLERENAALLNSALLEFADTVVSSFGDALARRGLGCPFFVSQNDGTLMDAAFVRRFPALTFASGPTNSLRGASRLTGLDNAIVVDIGGTTSDIGVLQDGFPRESNVVIEVGGVRTNFRMPDILAIGLGGGSLVADEGRRVGPQSVGHRLVKDGLVFGGETLTATDLVVAAGKASVGNANRVAALDDETIRNGTETILRMLDQGIDRMKPSSEPMPMVLVGGGAILVTNKLDAASEMVCPQHSDVANAIGAAIAQIGGEAERLVSYRDLPRREAIEQVTHEAFALARAAGADVATIKVADIEETAISYMDEGSTRLRIKAVGEIAALSRRESRAGWP